MQRKNKQIFTVMIMGLFLGGCASSPRKTDGPSEAEIIQVQIGRHIAASADRIHAQLTRLREIEQSSIHPVTHRTPASGDLTKPITLVWAGPIAPAVKSIADQMGWKFRIEGREPAIPPVAHIDAVQRPVYDVLRDLGLQVGRESGVIVDPQTKTLVVSYRPEQSASPLVKP